jgi:hypothetical protein
VYPHQEVRGTCHLTGQYKGPMAELTRLGVASTSMCALLSLSPSGLLTCAFEVGFSDWFGLLAGAYLPLGFGVKAGRG